MYKKITSFALTMLAASSLTLVATTPANEASNTNTVTVKADTVTYHEAPWEMTPDGSNLPEIQNVHNGNEIYYSIKTNDKNTKYFQQAVAKWNSLGVIKLVQVDYGDPNSQITMSTTNQTFADFDGDSAAQTSSNYNYNTAINPNAIMNTTTIQIENHSFKHLPSMNKRVIAMHELGHALGFAHDNTKIYTSVVHDTVPMIMNEYANYDRYYTLGAVEQHALAEHYGIQPANGFQNNNY